jgi:hypothetical protein
MYARGACKKTGVPYDSGTAKRQPDRTHIARNTRNTD